MYPSLYLKPDKLTSVAYRHPWVFSGALARRPDEVPHGCVVYVQDSAGSVVGTGTYSAHGTIAVRIFEFSQVELTVDWFISRITEAECRRRLCGYGDGTDTTGYRVIFGESDSVPGLVVDRFGSVLVIQLSTAGIEQLRHVIVEALVAVFAPSAILERSDLVSRKDEHLNDVSNILYGSDPGEILFTENGLRFVASPLTGQKTGFYLDQKDLRRHVTSLARGKSVLNLFSYTGSMGIAALGGGADNVHHVDASEVALAMCKRMAEVNGLDDTRQTTQAVDIFKWLGSNPAEKYDVVMLDPPALIKSQRDIEAGRKAYHFINRSAMRLVKPKGLFITSSCSTYFTEDDFVHTLRRASVQNGVHLYTMTQVRQSADHPVSVYFPESSYLKSFICQLV